MAYKALYRTYRPSTFEEVAGQQHIVKTLKNAIATNKIAHAYLFAGPRGTGKTSMAKLFAKALNCEEGIGHQCNKCQNCKAIIDGSHPDVLEIDAASNRGINEIKDLIEKVKYATILGKYKVYIIDEVHMMTPEAFNALLKTLEEPPEHVIFILATTEPHKILPTILSRCQRYDFTKVSDEDIKNRLKVILQKEQITYNDAAINIIISLADGGMRDALSILDQVLAYSGNKLDTQDVLDIFALESKEEKIALLHSIAYGDVGTVLNKINNYVTKGTDIKRLTNDILVMLKDSLIYSLTHNTSYFESLTEEDAKELSSHLSKERTLQMIDILMNAVKEYKFVSDINPLFEVTLLKLTSTKTDTSSIEVIKEKKEEKPIEKTIEKPAKVEEKVANIEEKPIIKQEETISLAQEIAPEIKLDLSRVEIPDSISDDHYSLDTETIIKIMVSSKKELKNQYLDGWKNIKKLLTHPVLGRAATMLADAYPLVVSTDILLIECQLPKMAENNNLISNQLELQNVIKNVFNRKMFIYSVSRVESVDLQRSYTNLYVVKKLPKIEDCIFTLKEVKGE